MVGMGTASDMCVCEVSHLFMIDACCHAVRLRLLRSFSGSSFSATPAEVPSLDYVASATASPEDALPEKEAGVKEEPREASEKKRPKPTQNLRRCNALKSTEFATPSPSSAAVAAPGSSPAAQGNGG